MFSGKLISDAWGSQPPVLVSDCKYGKEKGGRRTLAGTLDAVAYADGHAEAHVVG